MKICKGLKEVIRGTKPAIQGSKLYAGLMLHLKRVGQPKYITKIEQRLKWKKNNF